MDHNDATSKQPRAFWQSGRSVVLPVNLYIRVDFSFCNLLSQGIGAENVIIHCVLSKKITKTVILKLTFNVIEFCSWQLTKSVRDHNKHCEKIPKQAADNCKIKENKHNYFVHGNVGKGSTVTWKCQAMLFFLNMHPHKFDFKQ